MRCNHLHHTLIYFFKHHQVKTQDSDFSLFFTFHNFVYYFAFEMIICTLIVKMKHWPCVEGKALLIPTGVLTLNEWWSLTYSAEVGQNDIVCRMHVKRNVDILRTMVLLIWTAAWQNQQSGMCAQQRLRSAWASAQSDQSLCCALYG